MINPLKQYKTYYAGLERAWLSLTLLLICLLSAVIYSFNVASVAQYITDWTEAQRLILRTVFYGVSIILLPITNMLRYIQLRLNHTFPVKIPAEYYQVAQQRYFFTTLVSLCLVEIPGVFGLILFRLGDAVNSLYILLGLSLLGLYLYRPKKNEFTALVQTLKADAEPSNVLDNV
jgi:hypothetical protein